ncbi:hypothetical protein KEM52_004189 [Ascosphaera acerosa]|nr:hypothetical protein KEM52_004189 [Ascosphaera acerosa]
MRMKDLEPLRHHLTQGLQSQQQKPASRRSSPSRDRASSPRPSHKAQRARRGSDGSEVGTGIADRAVSLELLSKIMRDMSTREGMEAVLRHVEDVRKKENATDADTRVLTMLEEILTVATEPGVLRALSGAKATAGSGDSAELDESLKQVQSSLQATSHMTADVKTLVEEVKQGITALGSDIGERLAKQQQQPQQRRRQRADTPAEDGSEADEEDDDDEPASLEEIAEIVDTGLNALRRHLEEIIDDSHRRSVQSAALSRNELYDVVVRALSERRSSATSSAGPIGELERGVVATAAGTGSASAIARDDVMAAVKDGLEKYIPQVNVQTTGLDRGEVLKCLEDGLSRSADRAVVDYDKVRRIMSAALESWDGPPLPGTSRDAGLSPEDIERVVRKALDEAAHDTLSETTRKAVADGMTESQPSLAEDIVRGIRQHLDSKEGNMRARVVEREEILATIRDGLATSIPTRSAAHDDHQQLSDRIIATIKSTLSEMDGVPNATAAKASETSGTEEIIATIKQAFDDLSQSPRDIEINSEDISAAVKESMDQHVTEQLALLLEELKAELAKQPANGGSAAASGSGSINQQTLDAIKQSLEKIQLQVTKIHDGSSNILGKEAILQMLREELAQVQTGLQQTVTQSAAAIDPSTETARLLDALEKEFTHMRGTLKDLVQGERGAIDGKGEILDAIHEIASSELLKGPGVKQAIAEIKKELADMQQGMEPEAVAQAVKSVVDRVSSDNQLKEDSRVRKLIDEFGKGLDQVKQEIGQMGMTKHTEVVMESLRDDMKGIKERLDRKATADTTPSRDGILSIAGDIGIVKDLENLKLTLNAVHEVVKTTAEKQPIDAVRQSDISPLLDAVREVGRSVEGPDVVKKKDIEQMVSTVRETLEGTLHANAKEATGEAATQRELETVKSLLTALKGQMEDLVSPEGPVLIRSAEQLKDITTIVEETKLAVQALRDSQRVPESGEHSILSRADGVDDVSTVTKEIWMMMEDVKRKMEEREATRTNPDEKVYKKDVQGLETLTFEIKTMISDLQIPDPAVLPTKTDLQGSAGTGSARRCPGGATGCSARGSRAPSRTAG